MKRPRERHTAAICVRVTDATALRQVHQVHHGKTASAELVINVGSSGTEI